MNRVRNLLRLQVKEQLRSFGYGLVLVIPVIVISLIVFSAPEDRFTDVSIVDRGDLPGLPEIQKELGRRGYSSHLVRPGSPGAERAVATLWPRADGTLAWFTTAPQVEQQVCALVEEVAARKRRDVTADLLRTGGLESPRRSALLASAGPRAEVRDFVAGLACVIGSWFVAAVVAILAGMEVIRCLGRLTLTYRASEITRSVLLSAFLLGLPPATLMFATAAALDCRFTSWQACAVLGILSVAAGAGAGTLVVFASRAMSSRIHEVTFLSFMLIAQGFIVLAQYSGILTAVGSMNPLARLAAWCMPLVPLSRLFEQLCLVATPGAASTVAALSTLVALQTAATSMAAHRAAKAALGWSGVNR
jgi:hypothetical protein